MVEKNLIPKKVISIKIRADKYNPGQFIGFYREEIGQKRIPTKNGFQVKREFKFTLCKFDKTVTNNNQVFKEGDIWKAEVLRELENYFIVHPTEFEPDFNIYSK